VGPHSAGADPGPAGYGAGGTQPTVTDADLVLGYLDRESLLGGNLIVDIAAAERAIEIGVARPLRLTVPEAAARIAEVVNASMAEALRIVSIERGHDARGFSLVAFGGAGPVHAAALAEELQIPEVIVPPVPGAFSALGLIASDLKRDYVRTLYADLGTVDPARVAETLGLMEASGRTMLDTACVPAERRALLRQADLRYRRQAYELTVPLADGAVSRASLDAAMAAFHAKHEQTYGHANPAEPVQLVNLRLTAVGRLPNLTLAQPGDPRTSRTRARHVWFAATGFTPTQVYWRPGLEGGRIVPGPAIVEALDSTTVVPPGWAAAVDAMGFIRLTRS
jgi:N-methylhydantoinase A